MNSAWLLDLSKVALIKVLAISRIFKMMVSSNSTENLATLNGNGILSLKAGVPGR